MRKDLALTFPAFTFAALFPLAARAADCAPARLLNHVQMLPVVYGADSMLDLIPVTINGMPSAFLFDTGGIRTQIAEQLVNQMNLPVNRTGEALTDVSGRMMAGMTMIRQFQVGSVTHQDVPLPLSPNRSVRTGLFALNDITDYDADLDFGNNVLNLYSQVHCPGPPPGSSGAKPVIVPFNLVGGHIMIGATLDGEDFAAVIDTGSSGTDLRSDIAIRTFGLRLGNADTPSIGRVDGVEGLNAFRHDFKTLTFGGMTVDNPNITVIPSDYNNGSRIIAVGGPELIIGMNVLRKLHIYFAFGESKMYITPASLPAGVSPGPPAAPAATDAPTP